SLLPPPPTAGRATPIAPAERAKPELLVGPGRETRLLEAVTAAPAALILAADVEGAARWARRLGAVDRVARLDSGVSERARAEAWQRLASGDVRLAVGTRGALLAPLPAGAILALVDEHEAAHKPPGPPRMHSRDVVLERAAREGVRALLTSATPSVEMWWRADSGLATLSAAAPAPSPAVSIADARGLGRRTALTPALIQVLRETLRAGRRAFFGVSRRAAALGCDECGAVLRCPRCAVALAYSAAARTLTCRVCAEATPLVDTCPGCRGRRLGPFGWSAERVEQALARVIPKARIARYDPDARTARRASGRPPRWPTS
ncbi:MAG: hypothetical protein HY216_02565, partial [Candidatus Rokubacteria bacterium]|nr:hypothetical protein [Candidatus Rokubacteria bacterium]